MTLHVGVSVCVRVCSGWRKKHTQPRRIRPSKSLAVAIADWRSARVPRPAALSGARGRWLQQLLARLPQKQEGAGAAKAGDPACAGCLRWRQASAAPPPPGATTPFRAPGSHRWKLKKISTLRHPRLQKWCSVHLGQRFRRAVEPLTRTKLPSRNQNAGQQTERPQTLVPVFTARLCCPCGICVSRPCRSSGQVTRFAQSVCGGFWVFKKVTDSAEPRTAILTFVPHGVSHGQHRKRCLSSTGRALVCPLQVRFAFVSLMMQARTVTL